jgi:hypothetical protein
VAETRSNQTLKKNFIKHFRNFYRKEFQHENEGQYNHTKFENKV